MELMRRGSCKFGWRRENALLMGKEVMSEAVDRLVWLIRAHDWICVSLRIERFASTANGGVELCPSLPYKQRVFDAHSTPIDASTRYCAVYGHPVQHSASPPMQNAGFAALGLNWRYLACGVLPEELPQAIAGAKAMRFIGLNLTVPHKLLALPLVDELDASGARRGAINTIRFEARDLSGNWQPLAAVPPADVRHVRSVGFNTDADAYGALDSGRFAALFSAIGPGPRCGRGRIRCCGPARGRRRRAPLPGQSDAVQSGGGCRAHSPAGSRCSSVRRLPAGSVDLVLNATSLGFETGRSHSVGSHAVPAQLRQLSCLRHDLPPAETPFLQRARAAGCRVANGLGMLLTKEPKRSRSGRGNQRPLVTCATALTASVYG